MTQYYLASQIPEEYRNPAANVLLIPCFDEAWGVEVISIPEDWDYPLPDNISPMGHRPLGVPEASAALNVVLGIWTMTDACNICHLTPEDLTAEAEAWAVFSE